MSCADDAEAFAELEALVDRVAREYALLRVQFDTFEPLRVQMERLEGKVDQLLARPVGPNHRRLADGGQRVKDQLRCISG